MTDILTPAEITEITGATIPKKQIKVLRDNGVPFIVRADGRPALTLSALNARLCSGKQFNSPNMDALNAS